MTYSPVPTVVTGDTWTASQHNTYIRDNFAALHPYTARGDIAYRDNAGNIARLALGSATQCLKSHGGDPTYMGAIGFQVTHNYSQSINNNTPTHLTFNTEVYDTYNLVSSNTFTVPTDWGGLWLIGAGGHFTGKSANNGGVRELELDWDSIYKQIASFTQDADGSDIYVNVVLVAYLGATSTIKVRVKQISGGSLDFWYANFWGCKLA